jgi:hypothetical protein
MRGPAGALNWLGRLQPLGLRRRELARLERQTFCRRAGRVLSSGPGVSCTLLLASLALPFAASSGQATRIAGLVVSGDSLPIVGAQVALLLGGVSPADSTLTGPDGRFALTLTDPAALDATLYVTAVGHRARRIALRRDLASQAFESVTVMLATLSQAIAAVRVEVHRPRPARSMADGGGQSVAPGQDVARSLQDFPAADLGSLLATVPGLVATPGSDPLHPTISYLGQEIDAQGVTLNGLAAGGLEVPRDGVLVNVTTSTFDATRRSSGGPMVSVSLPGGSAFPARAVRLSLADPHLQWQDRLGADVAGRPRHVIASGFAAGPILRGSSYYSLAFQGSERTARLSDLLVAAPGTFARLGVDPDSVVRLLRIADAAGIPSQVEGATRHRASNGGSLMGRIDLAKDRSTQVSLILSGSGTGTEGAGIGTLSSPTVGQSASTSTLRLQPVVSTYLAGAVLDEASVAVSRSWSRSNPSLRLPLAVVSIDSPTADGGIGQAFAALGGSGTPEFAITTSALQFRNETSWHSLSGRHLFRLAVDALSSYRASRSDPGAGMFTFRSLADLESGAAASFARSIGRERRVLHERSALIGLGDLYRPTPQLTVQYGFQAGLGTGSANVPYNAGVDSLFGLRTDRSLRLVDWAPMAGFSWVRRARDGRIPIRWILTGGVSKVVVPVTASALDAVAGATGGAGQGTQVSCVGDGVPGIEWSRWSRDPSTIPLACGSVDSSAMMAPPLPRITALGSGLTSPHSWRAELRWNRFVTPRLRLFAATSWAVTHGQRDVSDANFDPGIVFRLPDEGGRPVYVEPSDISPAGATTATGSRRFAGYEHLTVIGSGGATAARQAQLGVRGGMTAPFGMNVLAAAAYTWQRVTERRSGFTSGTTAGDPRDVAWARSASDIRHSVALGMTLDIHGIVRVALASSVTSGQPFTPLVSGDVNGDGYLNDRAFVFAPDAMGDPVAAQALQRLLGRRDAVGRCLRGQVSHVATPNSCQGPWSASLNMSVVPGTKGVPIGSRSSLSFSIQNPLAALDRLAHGSHGLRGWGQPGGYAVDPALLYVRGFDAATQRYRYAVNPDFGSNRIARTLARVPFGVTLDLRVNLSPDPVAQQLAELLRPTARGGRALDAQGIFGRIQQRPLSEFAQMLSYVDSLHLSEAQVDSIGVLERALATARDSTYLALAEYLAAQHGRYGGGETRRRWVGTQLDILYLVGAFVPRLRRVLTADQFAALPKLLRRRLELAAREHARLEERARTL